MQLSILIMVIAAVVGPILLGLLLYRVGFSRAVAVGIALAILGAAVLVSREPPIDSSIRQQVTTPTVSGVTSTSWHAETKPKVIAGTESNSVLLEQIKALRSKISELEAARTIPSNDDSALEREKIAHRKTLRALEDANARLETIEADRRTSAEEPSREKTELRTAREELRATRLRLAIAEAEIERLKTAIRAAEPVPTAAPLPATPAPFAHAPEPAPTTRTPVTRSGDSALISTGATEQTRTVESRSAVIGQMLAKAMRSRSFTLVKLSGDEIVEGRRGSYYRITCPGNGAKPLSFGPGDYTFDAGYGPLASCYKAVQSLLLDALPQGSEHRLYVQGYASQRGFIRSKLFTARDAHLKSIEYLPRLKGRDRFSAKRARQSTGRRFANAELPNLRAANVAHWIAKETKGTLRPEILEGELKPGNNAESQSFAMVLLVTW